MTRRWREIDGSVSWGRVPVIHQKIWPLQWRDELFEQANRFPTEATALPYGLGRSYGDSCVNSQGILLSVAPLNRFIAFDQQQGILHCEAGVSLAQVLEFAVPRGWFLPVSPGTRFVTLGGAIANDIHGKNHHCAGTFGRYVKSFELLRSDGQVLLCSETENKELFAATIAGLGLTGLILSVELQLKAIESPFIRSEEIQFGSLEEFDQISRESESQFEYTVAWLDCVARGKNFGRGVFIRGNHAIRGELPSHLRTSAPSALPKAKLPVPFDFPAWALNRWTVSAFNTLYFHKQMQKVRSRFVPYWPFFYPLDSVLGWNRIYGKRGFFQFQCVVPSQEVLKEILQITVKEGVASFLAVLKQFGSIVSPGMLSFPRPGNTLCLDFANHGAKTLALLKKLEDVVRGCGGALYPAKDAVMSAETFQVAYPRWQEFMQYIDPRFSSDFWRRVSQRI